MDGWQEVVKIVGMLALFFFVLGWLMPRLGISLS